MLNLHTIIIHNFKHPDFTLAALLPNYSYIKKERNMARGAEGKLRRRNQRKGLKEGGADGDAATADDDGDEEVIDMFGTSGTGSTDEPFPSFPTSSNGNGLISKKSKVVVEDVDSDDQEDDDYYKNLPKKSKKKTRANKSDADDDIPNIKGNSGSGGGSGIKTTPLILLIMMIGTTLLPAVIFIGDYASTILSKTNFSSQIGYQLGIGSVPKQRILSFYEKHSPEKVSDVPSILSKHYGQYPTLIKKLERKYQDYGYFLGWEEDVTTYKMGMEIVQSTYDTWIQQYWNKYAPQVLKTAFRNIRYNLTFLYKKIRKVFKKHIWPKYLEPIFGVPDGAAAQKKKDAAEAKRKKEQQRKATSSGGSSRRKNTEYRDEDE